MATFIDTNGTETEVKPASEKDGFTLEELYALIGCQYVEWICLPMDFLMLFDEAGKQKGSPVNRRATEILSKVGGMRGDYIAGKVVILKAHKEMK